MSTTYNIVITGIQAGVERKTAIKQLAELLKVTEENVASMLASAKFIVKSGLDIATAAKYEAALQQHGADVIVELDADADLLSFDLPSLQPHIAPALPTSPEPEGMPGYTGMAFGIIWLALWAFILVMLFYSASKLLGLSNTFKGETTFDQATLIGKSSRTDMDEFSNSGGLENDGESTWRGYKVMSYRMVYDETNHLALATIGLFGGELHSKKFATVNNVKKTLAKDCGDKWTQANSLNDMRYADNNGMSCSIQITRSDLYPIEVTLWADPKK